MPSLFFSSLKMASEEKDPSAQEKTGNYVDEKMNCKNCKKEVFKTKIVMHITRNKDCKEHYGSELDAIKKFQTAEGKKKSNKKYYENNSQKMKESYDPDERRAKYLKSKELEDKITERIHSSDSDDLAEDEEFQKLHERREKARASKAKWYQKNSEKLAKSYNPEKRKARYQKEKEETKRIFEKDHKESAVDKDVCRSLNKDAKEKEYKKEWYKKNSENIKKRRAEAYDPAERKKQYQKFKRREEEYEAAFHKKEAEEYRSSYNKQLENEARNENKTRRDEAIVSKCAGCKTIIDLNLPEMNDMKKEMEKEIEELHCKFELEIDEIVQKGKNLNSLACHRPMYLNLYQENPPPYGSKLVKICSWKIVCST